MLQLRVHIMTLSVGARSELDQQYVENIVP